MSSVRRTFIQRNPWLLPALLALIIVGVIVGVVVAKNVKSSASATATPTPTAMPTSTLAKATVVVTATPKPGVGGTAKPTPTAASSAVPPTATPGGGVSTPLPGKTPVPTVTGLSLGMKTYPQSQVNHIQSQADAGNSQYLYYLDPIQVVKNTLPHYGFTKGFTILSPNPAGPTPTPFTEPGQGRPEVKVFVQYQGAKYEVDLVQPAKRGPNGIWLIVTILKSSS